MLSFMTYLYMAEDPDAATCLSNLAGLLVLNDFDNIIGYVFERRVNLKFPKLQMVDELLKDEFHEQSQHVAAAFTNLFMAFNLMIVFLSIPLFDDYCQHFDQYWDEIDEIKIFRAFSTKGYITVIVMMPVYFSYVLFFILLPFITIPLLSKCYTRK